MPSNSEIKAYEDRVISKYGLEEKMVFNTEVTRCVWSEESSTWTLHLKDLRTGHVGLHICSVLFSATGQLATPQPCTIPGYETFKGALFHSARWRQDVDLKDKNVVVIGNGCRLLPYQS